MASKKNTTRPSNRVTMERHTYKSLVDNLTNDELLLIDLHNSLSSNRGLQSLNDFLTRYLSTRQLHIAALLRNNLKKFIVKLPLLKSVYALKSYNNIPKYAWIDNFFTTHMFSETSIIHSIPESLKHETELVHKIVLLFAVNNTEVILHGSFVAHLVDPSIKYADIDFTSLQDNLIFTASYLLYLIHGTETHVLSIPWIINHRQLRVNNTDISMIDCLRIDYMTKDMARITSMNMASRKQRPSYLNCQNFVTQFFNFFKMMQLEARRQKIRHYKDNQMKILSAIYYKTLESLKLTDESMMAVKPYKITSVELSDDMINVRMQYHAGSQKDVTLFTGLKDSFFLDTLKTYLAAKMNTKSNEKLIIMFFPPMGSVFSEQIAEVYTADYKLIGTYVNVSRNDVYTTPDTNTDTNTETIDVYSIFNLLSVLGLHKFFRGNHSVSMPDHIRFMRSLIHYTTVPSSNTRTLKYRRVKNGKDHRVYSFYSPNLFSLPYKRVDSAVYEHTVMRDYITGSVSHGKFIPFNEYLSKVE